MARDEEVNPTVQHDNLSNHIGDLLRRRNLTFLFQTYKHPVHETEPSSCSLQDAWSLDQKALCLNRVLLTLHLKLIFNFVYL
jgi:hypothetical protein